MCSVCTGPGRVALGRKSADFRLPKQHPTNTSPKLKLRVMCFTAQPCGAIVGFTREDLPYGSLDDAVRTCPERRTRLTTYLERQLQPGRLRPRTVAGQAAGGTSRSARWLHEHRAVDCHHLRRPGRADFARGVGWLHRPRTADGHVRRRRDGAYPDFGIAAVPGCRGHRRRGWLADDAAATERLVAAGDR